jgi:large subunit ribosomal protein L12
VGKKVNEENVKKVVEATGAKSDEAKIKALVSSLEGVNIDETIKQAAIPVAAPAAPKEAAGEEKKAEKKEEEDAEDEQKKVEEAASGLASLFG